MAIATTVDLIPTQMWPQGDIRDPLGIWGARLVVVGDASGGGVKVAIRAAAGQGAAYVYTCYDAAVNIIVQATPGTSNLTKIRLLTSWPDIDNTAGIQAYDAVHAARVESSAGFTAPLGGLTTNSVFPNQRFLLLFDPRPSTIALTIVELEYGDNDLNDQYVFQAYGYFWDRSVLQAPGGPRHPGAS